jgi:hypothetical protein
MDTLAILLTSELVDHSSQLLLGKGLTQLSRYFFEVSQRNFACVVFIKQFECFDSFFHWIPLGILLFHYD